MTEHYGSFDELWNHLKGRDPDIIPVESLSNNEDAMRYQLNEVITNPTSFYVQQTTASGRTRWGLMRLDPGKVYETEDKVLIESLANRGYVKVAYNPKLEEKLQELGKEYKVELCKACGGRVKKIFYHAVEILP